MNAHKTFNEAVLYASNYLYNYADWNTETSLLLFNMIDKTVMVYVNSQLIAVFGWTE